jgi:2-hydroxy-3-keto-5-methylthiopentenyl-1-phosphate phosphatase
MFFCDFGGTVTKEDAIDKVLEEFATPQRMEKYRLEKTIRHPRREQSGTCDKK